VDRRAAIEAAKDGAGAAAPSSDGGATTSESEDEVESYRRRREEVLEAADGAFKDADDEFGSLEAVKGRLEGWKAAYPGQYADAYMADSVPALFAPFVRRELLAWSPLDDATGAPPTASARANGGAGSGIAAPAPNRGFDAQEWHRLLFDYGMPADGGAPARGDADALGHIVVLAVIAGPGAPALLGKDRDQHGRNVQKRLAQGLMEGEPFRLEAVHDR
jgi:GC-rich sequence DNA-binding factor